MSQNEKDEDLPLPPVLKASVHDVRYLATLLRGVNFINRATVTIAKTGFVIVVEEARTLLATAYIFADIFDEYTYNPETPAAPQDSQNSDREEEEEVAAFEIPLNTLIDCLNIFGTAGSSTAGAGGTTGKYKKWKRAGEDSDPEGDEDDARGRRSSAGTARGIDQYFGGSDKGTGMRMTYAGSGHPLTLLIAEDAAGPTTTCEIMTYDAEPHLELPFEPSRMCVPISITRAAAELHRVLKIILKSSWLRDALSELDPSCDKLTFIGNPPPVATNGKQRQQPRAANGTPMLRIQAAGTFGSTEMDYPNDRDVLETFECTRPVSFSYRFGHISRTLRALQSSTKTSLRIDDEGLLSLQFLMPAPKAKTESSSDAFIEFRCLALDDELV
ncbi:Rad1/Rec1/Rad17 [Mycena crocata]|nr:Rad1/Rec1/Rad17 [Mycena crocata]